MIGVEYEALWRRPLSQLPVKLCKLGNITVELLLFTELDTHFNESGLRKDDLKRSEKPNE